MSEQNSKFLSLVLRHKPETVGLSLDENGYVGVDTLLEAMRNHGKPMTREDLEKIVSENNKKRFSFNKDGDKIRAVQGHSVSVNLGLNPSEPPVVLYHGTTTKNLASIFTSGLIKGSRQHVHLSKDKKTAGEVGSRYGKPEVLFVAAKKMYDDGYNFYQADNGVWLVDHVPVNYISNRE